MLHARFVRLPRATRVYVSHWGYALSRKAILLNRPINRPIIFMSQSCARKYNLEEDKISNIYRY